MNNLRVDDGRTLTQLDDAAANNAYQKLFGGNAEITNAFKSLREGNEEEFMRNRMLAGLKQHMGSETWIKEGIEDAAKRDDGTGDHKHMEELKAKLREMGTSYDELVEKRFRPILGDKDNVNSTYFRCSARSPQTRRATRFVRSPDRGEARLLPARRHHRLEQRHRWHREGDREHAGGHEE